MHPLNQKLRARNEWIELQTLALFKRAWVAFADIRT